MKTITKDDIEISPFIPPVFPDDAIVAIDIELFGAQKGKLHRPIGDFACLSLSADGHTVYTITDQDQLGLLERSLERCWIGLQNLPFDVQHLRRWMCFPERDKAYDTMLLDRILWGGYFDAFRLKDLARRYLKVYIDKETVDEFEKATVLTDEMITMNAIDAAITWRVLQEQLKIAKDHHLKVWFDIDMPAMWAFMDFKGPMIDQVRWREVYEMNKTRAEELAKGFPFNPNAPAQAKSFINREYHLKVADTQEDTISKYAGKYPLIADLLEYRKISKRASTYGLNWLENAIEADGRVYTSYDVNRAESGRTASSNPNLQNIPIRDTPVYRECFVAAPGNVLVGCDYSQQEIRTLAYLCQDEVMIDYFKNGKDIYAAIATVIYDREITKQDKERNDSKSIVLGVNYGMSARGLARSLDIEEDEAEVLMRKFFDHFPAVGPWMDKQRTRQKYVETAYGRRCWLNPWSSEFERNKYNSPNQGSAADITKLAAALVHKLWKTAILLIPESFPLILQVHDELVAEVKEENAEVTKQLLYDCMIKAGEKVIPGIPIAVNIKIGHTWAEVH